MSKVAAIVLIIGLAITSLRVALCVISYVYDQVVEPHDINLPGLLATLALLCVIALMELMTLTALVLRSIAHIWGLLYARNEDVLYQPYSEDYDWIHGYE